jgi:hypothetical protein
VPERVQLRRTKGWRLPAGAVVVARPTKWGNPFKVGESIDRNSPLAPYVEIPGGWGRGFGALTSVRLTTAQQAVDAHIAWFIEQPHLMLTVAGELGGHDLACWCPVAEPCHADFLLYMANPQPEETA